MIRALILAVTGLLGACGSDHATPAARPNGEWIPAWIASPTDAGSTDFPAGTVLREIIAPHASGAMVRVSISNRLGTSELALDDVTLGRVLGGAALEPDSTRALTFGGATSLRLPAGATIYSDPVALDVDAFGKLAVSFTLPNAFPTLPKHDKAFEQLYVALPGVDFTELPRDEDSSWFAIAGIEVSGSTARESVVALGDSITDGYVSGTICPNVVTDPSIFGAELRYPDFLQHRLLDAGREDLVVLNAGISGNRVNAGAFQPPFGPSLKSRLDPDVLAQPHLRTVILLEGINDLALQTVAPDPQALIDGLDEVVHTLQSAGVRVLLGTLTPVRGFCVGVLGTTIVDQARQTVNDWIRSSSSAEAIVDFDACLRDPADPSHFRPEYDSGDHGHPSAAGYQAMADCVDIDAL